MITAMAAGLLAIGVLVFIHEFGHFIVAKMFNVGVPVFSIGMGPRLWGVYWRGTDYRISALPVGGYVTMAGADPFGDYDPDAMVDPEHDFMKKPIWQRLLVMFAGPAANLALPLVLFTAVLMTGEPNPDTTVGTVLAESPAEALGMQQGDKILAVAGERVDHWRDMELELAHYVGKPFSITIDRSGTQHELSFGADTVSLIGAGIADSKALGVVWNPLNNRIGVHDPDSPAGRAGLVTGDYITKIDGDAVVHWTEIERALASGDHDIEFLHPVPTDDGFETFSKTARLADDDWSPHPDDPYDNEFGIVPAILMVGQVAGESAALRAGVLPDDRIFASDGTPVRDFDHFIQLIGQTVADQPRAESTEPRAVELTLMRAGEVVTLSMVPEMWSEVVMAEQTWRPVVGVSMYADSYSDGPWTEIYYSFPEAVSGATKETIVMFNNTVAGVANLLTGALPVNEGLGGPVAIFSMAAEGAERGIYTYARFVGMISISLGLINLLPVPVLDGGQILFYLVEGVRGRPLSVALRERLQMIGVLGLVALMIFVTINDVNGLIERFLS